MIRSLTVWRDSRKRDELSWAVRDESGRHVVTGSGPITADEELNTLLAMSQEGFRGRPEPLLQLQRRIAECFEPARLRAGLLGASTVYIESSVDLVFALPWEEVATLMDQRVHETVSNLSSDLRFRSQHERASARHRPGGRVCFAWSEAGGEVPREHMQELFKRLEPWSPSGSDFVTEVPAATASDIARAMNTAAHPERSDPFHVLHILCHGGQRDSGDQGLWLGKPVEEELVLGRELVAALSDKALSALQLVVLSICRGGEGGSLTASVSPALAFHLCGVPAVIAWSRNVSESEAAVVSGELYERLLGYTREEKDALVGPQNHILRDVSTAFNLTRRKMAQRLALAGLKNETNAAGLKLYDAVAPGVQVRPFGFEPFKGFSHFGVRDRRFYFGRQHELEQLRGEITRAHAKIPVEPRLFAVLGESGVGKTSFLQAGLIARMRGESWQCHSFIPNEYRGPREDPTAMAKAFCEAIEQVPLSPGDGPHENVMVVLDQLEPVLDHKDLRKRMLSAIASLLGKGMWVVLGLRFHHVDALRALSLKVGGDSLDAASFLRRTELRGGNLVTPRQHSLQPVIPGQIRIMIRKPLELFGIPVPADAELRQLSTQVASQPGGLPFLQFALSLAWRDFDGSKPLVINGNPSQFLSRRMDELLAEFPGTDREVIVRRLLLSLVAIGPESRFDRLRPQARDELIKAIGGGEERAEQCRKILDRFIAERVIVESLDREAPNENLCSLSHDTLFRDWKKLAGWVTAMRIAALQLGPLNDDAASWDKHGRHKDHLKHKGGPLQIAWRLYEDFEKSEALGQHVHAYLKACSRREALGVWGWGVGGFLLLFLVGMALVTFSSSHGGTAKVPVEPLEQPPVSRPEEFGQTTRPGVDPERTERKVSALERPLAAFREADFQAAAEAIAKADRAELRSFEVAMLDRLLVIALASGPDCIEPIEGEPGECFHAEPGLVVGVHKAGPDHFQPGPVKQTVSGSKWCRGAEPACIELGEEATQAVLVAPDLLVFATKDGRIGKVPWKGTPVNIEGPDARGRSVELRLRHRRRDKSPVVRVSFEPATAGGSTETWLVDRSRATRCPDPGSGPPTTEACRELREPTALAPRVLRKDTDLLIESPHGVIRPLGLQLPPSVRAGISADAWQEVPEGQLEHTLVANPGDPDQKERARYIWSLDDGEPTWWEGDRQGPLFERTFWSGSRSPWVSLDQEMIEALLEVVNAPTSDEARDRALERLREFASRVPGASPAEDSPEVLESVAAARFLLERWGACRTTKERIADAVWCRDPASWCHGRLFQTLGRRAAP